METQALVAQWAHDNGFVFAVSTGAGRQGRDILNTPGLSIEVKGRADFNPLAWVRQAVAAADGDLPFVVLRCNGQGPKNLYDWPVILRLGDMTELLRSAGYFPEKP